MTEELDKSGKVGSGDGSMGGGFTMPPEGDIDKGTGVLMQFTGVIEPSKKNPENWGFEVAYIDDPNAKTRIYTDGTKQAGLIKRVDIGVMSGVFDRIDKKRKAQGKPGTRDADGEVAITTLVHDDFREQLKTEIEGLRILCTIKHTPGKPYKDEESGEEKQGYDNANVNKIAPADTKVAVAPAGEKTEGPAGESPKKPASGW